MKPTAYFLMSALLLGGAVAQTSSRSIPATAPASTPSNESTPNISFGLPKVGSNSSSTRIVFDLLPGVNYTMTPMTNGLRLEITGARVIPALNTQLGPHVSEYRAGGGQVMLVTPHALSMSQGWRATESKGEAGNRTLVLDFGRTLSGGADMTTVRAVRSAAPTPQASSNAPVPLPANVTITQEQINQAWQAGRGPIPATPLPSNPVEPAPSNSNGTSEAPGDDVAPVPNARPAAIGSQNIAPSATAGRVPGSSSNTALGTPRIGPHPGMTRVVLDLPAGATYRVVPSGLGLRVELGGVSASSMGGQNVSSELRSWRLNPTAGGADLSIITGNPTSEVSGWRADLLPPAGNDGRYRLVLDLSPAFANIRPMSSQEKRLAAVPPLLSNSGLAMVSWQNAYVQPRVVIDAGHGGKDPGAVGAVVEKEINLEIAKRVQALLKAAGVDVIMTRTGDYELHRLKSTDLAMRAKMAAQRGAQLFVSIHANAIHPQNRLRAFGVETWWNKNHPRSMALAQLLQYHMITQSSAFDRGIRSSQPLSVLYNNTVPAALVEVGFVSHPIDGLNLLSNAYIDRVSVGIAAGIREALVTGITADGPSEDMQYVVSDQPATGGIGGGSNK